MTIKEAVENLKWIASCAHCKEDCNECTFNLAIESLEKAEKYNIMVEKLLTGEITPDQFTDYYNKIVDEESEETMVRNPIGEREYI